MYMVAPRNRSRIKRHVFVRTPGGTTKIHYRQRKAKLPHCSACRTALAGIPTGTPRQMKNRAKSAKRPERPFGGKLCTRCMRLFIIQEVRGRDKQ